MAAPTAVPKKGKKSIHTYQARGAAKGARRSTPAAAKRSYTPQQPTPERYQQIQQALVEKGYYKGDANGQWNADSADALKRFQTDQNLTADGKLSSLSLIALGLGPKRIAAQPATASPAPPEPGVRE
jgi:hypothetical protein